MARGFFENLKNTSSPADGSAGKLLEKKKPQMPLPKRKAASQDDGGGGGGGHESDDTLWLYSFNDMLFNLLLFFIVMYSISQIDEKKFAEVQQALQGDKKPQLLKEEEDKDGVVIGPRNGALDAKQLASSGGEAGGDKSAEIAAAIRFMLERQEKADVKLARGAGKEAEKKEEAKKKSKYLSGTNIPLPMQLVFPHTEFFAKGTADLTPQGQINLKQLAAEVAVVEKLSFTEIEVHTEFSKAMLANLKGQSDFSTLKLATMRAGVFFEYFIKEGIPHKKVASAGYADGRPIVLGENLSPKQREDFSPGNDRIVVILKKDKAP
ncbi:MAG: OmpA/MotB family protein [Silvanigrellaceae bacterium]